MNRGEKLSPFVHGDSVSGDFRTAFHFCQLNEFLYNKIKVINMILSHTPRCTSYELAFATLDVGKSGNTSLASSNTSRTVLTIQYCSVLFCIISRKKLVYL